VRRTNVYPLPQNGLALLAQPAQRQIRGESLQFRASNEGGRHTVRPKFEKRGDSLIGGQPVPAVQALRERTGAVNVPLGREGGGHIGGHLVIHEASLAGRICA
jgi:hypothetical protein